MVRDSRWPALPLLILRGVQLLLAIIVLGSSGWIISIFSPYQVWWANMSLVSALFTLIYVGINFFLFFTNLLLPLAIVITDAFLLIFWLISMAGTGASGFLAVNDCELYSYYTLDVTYCKVVKLLFAISFLNFLLFIGTLVIASIILHKNRKDLRGAKHNSGLTPDGEAVAMETSPEHGVSGIAPEQQYYPEGQEPKNEYQVPQQPGYQGQEGYYQQQQVPHVVSPPQTPAPYQQYAGSPPPHEQYATPPPQPQYVSPPPPPPVGAQEMPSYRA